MVGKLLAKTAHQLRSPLEVHEQEGHPDDDWQQHKPDRSNLLCRRDRHDPRDHGHRDADKQQQHREKLGRFLPWNELNTLPDPKNNWLATKGGTYIFGVRNDTGIFHSPAGEVALAVFTEGGTGGHGHNADGNVFIGEIGRLVWEALSG